MSNDNAKQMSASDRLKGLEASINLLDQTLGNATQSLVMLSQKVGQVDDTVEAVVRLSEAGQPINRKSIESMRVEMNMERLEDRINLLVEQGLLSNSETVDRQSFIVGRETNKDTGEVTNPRMQFALQALNEKSQLALEGKKAGDRVQLNENNPIVLEIERVYSITVPEMPQEEPEAVAEEAAAQ
jgi:hypothetical protein